MGEKNREDNEEYNRERIGEECDEDGKVRSEKMVRREKKVKV